MVMQPGGGREEASRPERFLGVLGEEVRARKLAASLDCAPLAGLPDTPGWILRTEPDLALVHTTRRQHPVRADFLEPSFQRRLARATPRSERLARAVGLHKRPRLDVLDATAGLGRDSVLLASLGARVHCVERDPLVYVLLRDGLEKLRSDAGMGPVADRISCEWGDAAGQRLPEIDVVYLDPMFEPAQHRQAAGRETAALRALVREPVEEARLADAFLERGVRVVVKRAGKAGPLAGRTPHHALPGRAVRFDVYEP